MNKEDQIKQIDLSIKDAQELVEAGSALQKLYSNKDFKTVIIKGYFEQESIRLVHLKADPSMQSADSQLSIVKQMDSIGNLKQFFYGVMHRASMATKAIESDEAAREELLMEGNE